MTSGEELRRVVCLQQFSQGSHVDHHEFTASIAFDHNAPPFDAGDHSATVAAKIPVDRRG
jgi:hypothetical protein